VLTTTERPRTLAAPLRAATPPRADPRFTAPSDVWATLALAGLTATSLVGFTRIFAGHTWIGPALVTLAGVHLLSWALRRWHIPLTAALVLGGIAVWLLSVWTVLGPYTRYGIPGSGTWNHFTGAISQARTDISATSAPVQPTAGFRLLVALGAGLVALLSDAIAFRWRYVLLGAAPAFALFVVCCTSGQGRGRGLMIAALVVGVLLYLLAQRAPGGATAQVWFAGVRQGAGAWTLRVGVSLGAAAVAVSALVAPLVHGEDGVGALGWRSGIGPGGGGTRTVANPIVDLQTRLIQLSNTPVFTVQSSVPSYWRLTSLDSYTGSTWVSTGSYRGFHTTLPGTRPLATREVQEHFVITQLESVWLPSAFNPIKVDGVHDVTYDPASNSLITGQPNSDGLRYTVTSYQYLSTLSAADLRAAPSFSMPSSYTALPNSIPPQVPTLAQSLTAGKTTEYDKALAIQDYLVSPRYHYTLQPPLDGIGSDAIYNFLFVTRQGYCQQFAGAYAVLARLAGLPTRLAVGFATGTLKGGVYHVTDAQAHTWPEVYFGPRYGWIPFEPTPGFTDPGTSGYENSFSASRANQQTTSPTSTPISPSTTALLPAKRGSQGATTTTVASAATSVTRSKGPGAGWLTVLALFGVGATWLGINVGSRRLRWALRRRRSRSEGAEAEVLASWADVDEVMTWAGLGRRPSETFDEYARRATERIAWMSIDDALPRAVTRLAALAGLAAFAPTVPAAAPNEARSLAINIRRELFRTASFRRRLVWGFLPRPGYRSNEVGLPTPRPAG
jgi:transglutaminase-like putative cysteine protease